MRNVWLRVQIAWFVRQSMKKFAARQRAEKKRHRTNKRLGRIHNARKGRS